MLFGNLRVRLGTIFLTMAKKILSTLIDLMVSWVFLVRTTPVNLLLLIVFYTDFIIQLLKTSERMST